MSELDSVLLSCMYVFFHIHIRQKKFIFEENIFKFDANY